MEHIDGYDAYMLTTQEGEHPAHADYPHTPGALYGCLSCEAECYCPLLADTEGDGFTECVYCEIAETLPNVAAWEMHD